MRPREFQFHAETRRRGGNRRLRAFASPRAVLIDEVAGCQMVQMLTTRKECDPINNGQTGQRVNLLFLAFWLLSFRINHLPCDRTVAARLLLGAATPSLRLTLFIVVSHTTFKERD